MKINILKIVLGVMGTIIMGAIGSGVWERLISPALSYLSNLITSVLSNLFQNYSDSLYKSAAAMQYNFSGRPLGLTIMIFIVTGLAANALFRIRGEPNEIVSHVQRAMLRSYTGRFGVIFFSMLVIALMLVLARSKTISDIQDKSFTRMEISRPYIGEQAYLKFRSQFLLMQNKADYQKFVDELNAKSKQSGAPANAFSEP